jgi:glutathione S-transferase
MGKVPTIRHGDTIVTECAAICAYLADAFAGRDLAPPASHRDRGPYYRWLFFAAGPLEAAVTNKAMGFEVPKDKQSMSGYGSAALVLDTIEAWVKDHEFVAGNRFSAADLYLSSHLGWGMQFGTIEKRAAFERYVGRHHARPAAALARAIDDALAAKKI